MPQTTLRYAPVISLFCTIIAIILTCLSTFSKKWWLVLAQGDREKKEYGLMNDITCPENICSFTPSGERDGWITFVFVTGVLQWCFLLVSLVFQGLGFACKRHVIVIIAIVILAIGSFISCINTFVTIGKFSSMSMAYERMTKSNDDLLFQPLPLGINAIGCFFTFPAVIFLATSEKRSISTGERKTPAARNGII